LYTGCPLCPQNGHLLLFWITLSINNFGTLNPEKIWHKHLTDLSTSPVRCSHFTLGKSKKVIFSTLLFTYFRLFTLPRLIFYRVIRQIKGRRFFGGAQCILCYFVRINQVCGQLHVPTYADNASLPAFTRRTPLLRQSIDISCPPDPHQQTCSSGFAAVGQPDGRTHCSVSYRLCSTYCAGSGNK